MRNEGPVLRSGLAGLHSVGGGQLAGDSWASSASLSSTRTDDASPHLRAPLTSHVYLIFVAAFFANERRAITRLEVAESKVLGLIRHRLSVPIAHVV